ncbi:hypothetical protein [Thioalkalivibrio sp. ALE19]|uniref:hypothetical protein n=1 Tax=Thioalkalivibrio sp. ALE19 TaxID=1266909 RepID=UPI0012DD0148|nr:hypothetical protein [Thioalkalivibrio sp. ALE19]
MIDSLEIWLPVVRDLVMSLAAVVAAFAAIFGLWTWRRELAGRERFHAAKQLVMCGHRLWKACDRLRMEAGPGEAPDFDRELLAHLTSREKWVMSERAIYLKRIDAFEAESQKYSAALLEARVLMGSWVYGAFLPFGKRVNEALDMVNEYLHIISDDARLLSARSPVVKEAKKRVSLPLGSEDQLSEKLAEELRAGEERLLRFLDRSKSR